MSCCDPADRWKPPADSGVLLIGHGTRDPDGHAEFLHFGQRLAESLAPLPVEVALLELQPPTITTAWQRLVDAGVRRVLAAPLLLFAAGHAKSDIPDELNRSAATTPGVEWFQSRPLSRTAELVGLVADRWRQAIGQAAADPDRTAVIVVGRGSHDPCAQADLRVLTACAARRCPVRRAEVAFYAMAEPKLDHVIASLAADPEVHDVIIQPHLLFQGAIHRTIRQQVAVAAAADSSHHYQVADYLGPDPAVVASLIRRIQQACEPPTKTLASPAMTNALG